MKFDGNGAEGTMADQSFTYDVEQALTANGFTKTGYTFAGWKLDDTTYEDGATVKNLATEGALTLTAQWTANSYTVKFDGNGAEGTMADQSFTYDVEQALTANGFTKTGYTFAGWKLDDTTYEDGATVKNLATEGALTLTAQWTANSYTVKFDGNGAEGTMADQSFTYDVEQALTANGFTKTGYTFAGWKLDDTTYEDGATVKNLATEGALTLTAQWTANSYTVKFDGNGAEGTMADQSFTYDAEQALTANGFTKTGYTFAGWKLDDTTYEDGATVKNLATEGALTLTAQWTANSYTVKFDGNGAEGTMADQSFTYDAEQALTANGFTKTGYTFAGWKLDDTTYEDGATVKNLATEGALTLTAQWTANSYTVKFDGNGAEGTMADQSFTYDVEQALTANGFTKTGYTFAGWKLDDTTYEDGATVKNLATEGALTLTAQWTANSYTVKFDGNGAEGTMADQSFTYDVEQALTANGFTKTGYTFAGWKLGDTTYEDGATVKNLATEGALTLTAQWTANSYTVKFDGNGAEGTMADQSFTYDVEQALTANGFTKTGYTFAGWKLDDTTYEDGATVKNLATSGRLPSSPSGQPLKGRWRIHRDSGISLGRPLCPWRCGRGLSSEEKKREVSVARTPMQQQKGRSGNPASSAQSTSLTVRCQPLPIGEYLK
ncbi:MAG: InlB B-repeat-containing protein [Oscillospiraceae bacterium]